MGKTHDYKRLLEEARAAIDEQRFNSAPCYTHAFVAENVGDCIAGIQAIKRSEFSSDSLLFGVRADVRRVKFYLKQDGSGTLLWSPIAGLKVIQALSTRSRTPLHWISVFEQFTARAYICFEDGQVSHRIIDSEDCWLNNIMGSDDLSGKGKRQFASLEAFLDQIKERYVPRDVQWSYEKLEINRPDWMSCIEWIDG